MINCTLAYAVSSCNFALDCFAPVEEGCLLYFVEYALDCLVKVFFIPLAADGKQAPVVL